MLFDGDKIYSYSYVYIYRTVIGLLYRSSLYTNVTKIYADDTITLLMAGSVTVGKVEGAALDLFGSRRVIRKC